MNPVRRASPAILVLAITIVVFAAATRDWSSMGRWAWMLTLILLEYVPALRTDRRVQAFAWVGTAGLVGYMVWSLIR